MKFIQKKNIIILFGTLLFCTFGFAQASKAKVWVIPTEGKNLGNAESRWLPDEVHKALRANITNYSGLVVAEENSDSFADIQAKSYNDNISSDEITRMGKQIGANHVIRSIITKAGTSYNLNVIFQNLESAEHLAESNKSSKTEEGLYMNPGCAVNEATIELCKILDKDFGTRLSSYNERILRYGDNDLSAEEEKKYLDDEEKRLNESIKKRDKEISSASLSTEIDAETKKIQEELKKTQDEEKLKQIKKRKERLAQEAANKAAEDEDQKNRSNSQKKRISDAEKSLNKKVESLRNQKYDSSSVLAQIGVIEAKKKAILEIREKRYDDAKKIAAECEIEVENKKNEIMNAPLRNTQKKSNGEMRDEVRTDREKRAKEAEKKLRSEYNKSLADMNNLSVEAENSLMNQIGEHIKELQKPKKADNIQKRDLKLDVNRFIAEKDYWKAVATFVSDGIELYSDTIYISYKSITGKEPDVLSDEYADEVDLYNSLFSKNMNPITAELTYYFTSAPDNQPSVYILHVESIKLTHTENGKKIQEIKVNKNFSRQMTPIYDIRDEGIKQKIAENEQKKVERQENKELLAQEKEQKRQKQQEEKLKRKEGLQRKNEEFLEKFRSKNCVILSYIALGINFPLNFGSSEKLNSNIPFGASAHLLFSYTYWSIKGNGNFDFINYSDRTSVIVSGTASLGITPIHSDYLFLGLYATAGFENIENYNYISYGGSLTALYNFLNNWGLFLNCDITNRGKSNYKGDEKIPPYDARFQSSWRICPSIGISYNWLKG